MAATIGFENITKLAHLTETRVVEIIEKGKANPDIIQGLFLVADRLSHFSSLLMGQESISDVSVEDIIQYLQGIQLDEVKQKKRDEEADLRVSASYKVKIKFSQTTMLKGARGFQILRELEKIATIEQSTPDKSIIEEGELNEDPEFEVITNEDEQKLLKTLEAISDIDAIEITPLLEEVTRVSLSSGARREIQTVRVNLTEVDEVLDLLGELILSKNRVELNLQEILSTETIEEFHRFEQIIKRIQDNLTQMRMVSLSRIFETYPRIIRDIAKERNIEAELLLQGTHFELDRSVIDQVNEALLHLIRNSAVHGIEPPDIRKNLSKRGKGTIVVSAEQDRGEVVFKVSDDGAGLDVKKIRKKAIERKIISKTAVLSDAEITELIFKQGFSTVDLTLGAGRGIGLDVVKSTIEEIGGTLQVQSTAGKGSEFTFRVPQTVAIIQALVIRIHDYLFALPMLNIEKIYSIHDTAVSFRENRFFVVREDKIISVIDLEQRLKIPEHLKTFYLGRKFEKEGKNKIIVWRKGDKHLGMKVTDVYEQREIVTKELDTWVHNYPGLSGATILDEDQVVLIIDPATL